jgi:protein-tyrosine phosphatase
MRAVSIPLDASGNLSIMPHPPGHDQLRAATHDIRALPTQHLVSLLTSEEITRLGLNAEAELFEALGGQFQNFSIPDRGIPNHAHDFLVLGGILLDALTAGEGVLIHCWGGVGRSGLLACSILCLSGVAPRGAIDTVTTSRGLTSPETQVQRDFLYQTFR